MLALLIILDAQIPFSLIFAVNVKSGSVQENKKSNNLANGELVLCFLDRELS